METAQRDRGQGDMQALRDAIAACGSEPSVLIWARAKPRIATMRPVGRALVRAGYRTFVAFPPALGVGASEFADDLRCFEVEQGDLSKLGGVTVFVSSEQNISAGPAGAIRFAIHHSLPDYNLRRDYCAMIAEKPIVAASADYYGIPVPQRPQVWNVESFAPHVDAVLPETMLRGRRDTLTIVPFGYPKIDQMMAEDTGAVARDTITYAPTQSTLAFSSVNESGATILSMLLESFPDHRIAFRPYPGADHQRLADLIAAFSGHPRFDLDASPTGEDLMRRSALLVTDRSSIAMSFGIGYCRPVVFYRAGGLMKPRPEQLEKVDPIGLRAGSVEALREGVGRMLRRSDEVAARIGDRRGDLVCNLGRSGEYLAEILPDMIAGRNRPEWVVVPRRPFPGGTSAEVTAQLQWFREKLASTADKGAGPIRILEAGFRNTAAARAPAPVKAMRLIARRMRGLRRYLFPPRDRSTR